MATSDLTLVSEATLPAHLTGTLNSAKSYADTKKTEAVAASSTDASTKVATAKTEAIADATTKYGGLPARVTTLEGRTEPIAMSGSQDLDTWFTPGRRKTVTSGISGNPALHYPPGAVHGFLDTINMGTDYVEHVWTDTWGGWTASRRYYGTPNPTWTSWSRRGESEAAAAVAPLAARVSVLEGGGAALPLRTIDSTGDYRPDAFIVEAGTVTYWTGPSGTERIGWGYRGEGYVGKIATAPGYTVMQIKKVQSNDEIEVSCLNPTTGRHVTYRVQGVGGGLQDDQRRIEETWVGPYAGTAVAKELLIMPRSNIEWAFQIDVAGNKQFAPYHGAGSATAIQYEPATITDALGVPINIAGLAVDAVLSNVQGLKIRQRLYLKHPDAATRWAAVDEVRTIAPDGMLQAEAVVTFLQDTIIGSNYGPMTPVDTATFGNMNILGGTAYQVKTVPPAATEYLTIAEGHASKSALFTSSTKPDAFVAVTYLDPAATFKRGDSMEETGSLALRLEQRSGAGLTKLYPTVFTPGSVIPAGTVWRPSAQWRYGETANASQYI